MKQTHNSNNNAIANTTQYNSIEYNRTKYHSTKQSKQDSQDSIEKGYQMSFADICPQIFDQQIIDYAIKFYEEIEENQRKEAQKAKLQKQGID